MAQAITVQGTPAAAAATSIALPTHAIGDLIVLFVYRNSLETLPTKPGAVGTVPAWVDILAAAGNPGTTSCMRSAYFVATATNHTSGTWTNATGIAAIVLRGQALVSIIGGTSENIGLGQTNTARCTAATLVKSDGSSFLLHCHAHKAVTAWGAVPANYTRQASVATQVCLNNKTVSTTAPLIEQPCTAATDFSHGHTVEILAKTPSLLFASRVARNTLLRR